jgi:hypothetical protein
VSATKLGVNHRDFILTCSKDRIEIIAILNRRKRSE